MADNSRMREVKSTAVVAQSAARIYALINDIESYPAFLPWCKSARVESRSDAEVVATLGMKLGPLQLEFTTRNQLDPEHRITIALERGPFKQLDGIWLLTPIGDSGCRVDLQLQFEFSIGVLGAVLTPLFTQISASLVGAFVARARQVYG